MKIIYHCFGGSHSSVVAAALHLGLLPDYKRPKDAELLQIPYFDGQVSFDHGKIRYLGTDEKGNTVYILGRRHLKVERVIKGVAGLAGIDNGDYRLVNTMPCVNWLMMLGGGMSRRFNWVWLGRPLVCLGIRQNYPAFVNLVNRVKTGLESRGDLLQTIPAGEIG